MKILYFAWVKQRVGLGEEDVFPPDSVKTISDLVTWLIQISPAHAQAFADLSTIRIAVNQDFAGLDHPITAQDEIAFFPPITGGSHDQSSNSGF